MRRIIVCIKGVPKPGTVKVDPQTHTLKRESAELIFNPPDYCALEMAMRLKEKGPFEVVALSMGPPNMIPLLQKAYALGADKLYLISDRAFAGSDTLATSIILAKAITLLSPYDLVIMGARSIDGETGQVPPETASLLDLPSICYVKDIKIKENNFAVLRETDFGEEEIEVSPPAVLSILPELDYVRPPSLKKLLKCQEVEPTVLTNQDLHLPLENIGLSGSPTQVVGVTEKLFERRGEIWEGSPEELAERLINFLQERGFLQVRGG